MCLLWSIGLGAVDRLWRGHAQGGVRTPGVVEQDCPRAGPPRFGAACEGLVQSVLLLEDSIEPFSYCVLGAVPLLRHAHFQASSLGRPHEGMGGILATPIGVMNRTSRSPKPLERHSQGLEHNDCFEALP